MARPGFFRTLLSQLRLAVRLLREPRVPLLAKAVPIAAGLYLLSPIDLVPDVLPFIGEIDDLGLMLVALTVFLRLCPPAVAAFHEAAIAGRRPFTKMPPAAEVIDAEWRRD